MALAIKEATNAETLEILREEIRKVKLERLLALERRAFFSLSLGEAMELMLLRKECKSKQVNGLRAK